MTVYSKCFCGLARRRSYSRTLSSSLDPQGEGQPPSRPHHPGHKLQLLRSGLAEEHCLGRRLDDGAEIRQRHGLVVHLHLPEFRQLIHEPPQAETVEIDITA